MPKHIHAELMKQYAEDAMTTDEPWKLWEVYDVFSNKWWVCTNLTWDPDCKYRRKQKYEVKFDNNLNDAGWDFTKTCNKHENKVMPVIFNNCKSILKEVIEGYLERMTKEEVEKLLETK